MKRSEFEEYLERHGCRFNREKTRHSSFINPALNKRTVVPRHNELSNNRSQRICEPLGIPHPWE